VAYKVAFNFLVLEPQCIASNVASSPVILASITCYSFSLQVMFTQFQYSDKQVLPPDTLRQALSETFQNQQRFQMGFMDDAAECFVSQLYLLRQ